MMGVICLFATSILGARFEEMVANEYADPPDEPDDDHGHTNTSSLGTTAFQAACYRFANGIGSLAANLFELLIYAFIILTVTVGIIQKLPENNHFHQLEWIAVVMFTFEYLVHVIGAGADPEFSHQSGIRSRISFVFSFFSVIDLAAILSFYIASYAIPANYSKTAGETTFECYDSDTGKPLQTVGFSKILKQKDTASPDAFVSGKERRGSTLADIFTGLGKRLLNF